ncbi:MAG: Glycosyl transferase, group 2 family protein [Anaerolineae bacterium]|jgi:glycosyltransferase involved in cell wall biosynthesis|nr:MAG: Glycosyl transferase, group 2 family protein [Anaerolineae bacterium]
MAQKPLLSLCMIVKNEEVYLPQCLESARGVVDEIVIVDTGSTDNTRSIAKQYGASVYEYEWQDDFAAARNYSLEKANGVFILFLDADEELSPNAKEQLRPLLLQNDAEGFYLIVRCFGSVNSLAPFYDSEQVRLFRNRPQYRFENAIHEMIYPSIVAHGGKLIKGDLIIHHYGYLKQVVQASESRIERDRRLLEKMYQEDPTSQYVKAKLGFIYLLQSRYPEALQLLQEVVQEIDSRNVEADFLHTIFIALAQTAQAMGNYALARECARAGWALNTQPSLTRSSKFYYATSTAASILSHLEALTQESKEPLARSRVQEDLARCSKEIDESISILNELYADRDLSPQAKENLAIWQQKTELVRQMVERISEMMTG